MVDSLDFQAVDEVRSSYSTRISSVLGERECKGLGCETFTFGKPSTYWKSYNEDVPTTVNELSNLK